MKIRRGRAAVIGIISFQTTVGNGKVWKHRSRKPEDDLFDKPKCPAEWTTENDFFFNIFARHFSMDQRLNPLPIIILCIFGNQIYVFLDEKELASLS